MTSGWTSTPSLATAHAASKMARNLHLGQFGNQDAQAHAARTQHRVQLAQRFHAFQVVLLDANFSQGGVDFAQRVVMLHAHFQVGQVLDQFVKRGQELMQRRIDQANDDRVAVHGPEQALKVAALQRQQLIKGIFAVDCCSWP